MTKKWTGLFFSLFVINCLSADPGEISQREILARAGDYELVRQARQNLSVREETLAAVSGWLGAQAAVTPSIRYDDKPGDIALAETGIRADILFPLGASSAEHEKRIAARELAELARRELEESYGKAFLDLFRLYAAAFTAQEDRSLAEAEADYYRLKLESATRRASRGLEAVSDLADAESEYQAAAERVIQTGMDARVAWFNLAYASGQDVVRPGPWLSSESPEANLELAALNLPAFQAPDLGFIVKDLPQPGLLIAAARNRVAVIQAQRQRVAAARRSLETHSPSNFHLTPRILYATPDASASVGYGTSTGAISLGFDWKPYINPDSIIGNSTPPDHSLSVSVLVSGSFNPNASSERRTLEAALRLEESKLAALEQEIDLLVRSKFAAYIKARDSLAESERTVRLVSELAAANRARQTLGQLTPEDVAANELLIARSAYSVAKARAALGQAYLEAVAAANAWDLAGIITVGAKP